MLMGATTGLLIGAMSRNKRNQTKHKDNKIYVYQPFPGTLVAKHKDHHEPPEFFTIATNETVPSDVAVVLRPGQIGTPIQIQDHHHFNYSVINPGDKIPHGDNVKIIVVKLAPGTLVQITQEDGSVVQAIFPPGQQIPPGSVVLRRPDGKPPGGTLVLINQPNGQQIQQIIPKGQPIPPGATVIPTEPESGHKHKEKKKEYPDAPKNVTLNDDISKQVDTNVYPPPPSGQIPDSSTDRSGAFGGINLSKDTNSDLPPAYSKDAPSTYGGISLEKTDNNEHTGYSDLVKGTNTYGGISLEKKTEEHDTSKDESPVSGGISLEKSSGINLDKTPAIRETFSPYVPGYQPPPMIPSSNNQPPAPIPTSQPEKRNSVVPKSKPPEWVPDASTDHCSSCKSQFTFFHRRHHCRNCGQLFCSDCTKHRIPLPHFSIYTPERVCNDCFTDVKAKK